jgi:NAD(P)-dependent dehydrogenase (short-subunit alcohol dehydrogenase family)
MAALPESTDSLMDTRPSSALDRFDLTGRVALITGGTRGLGFAMARGFAQAGAHVVVVSRKADACDEVVAALRAEGANAAGCACHVGHWDKVDELVEEVYRDFGRVDVLVNNAGIYPHVPFEELTFAQWRHVLATNLDGVFLCSHAVYPTMRSRGYGRIMSISSGDVLHRLSRAVGLRGLEGRDRRVHARARARPDRTRSPSTRSPPA